MSALQKSKLSPIIKTLHPFQNPIMQLYNYFLATSYICQKPLTIGFFYCKPNLNFLISNHPKLKLFDWLTFAYLRNFQAVSDKA